MPGCLQPLKWLTKEMWNQSDMCPTPFMRDWKVLFRPALLSRKTNPKPPEYFCLLHSKRKGINDRNGISVFPLPHLPYKQEKKKSKKGNFCSSIGNVGEEGFCSNFSKTFFFFKKKRTNITDIKTIWSWYRVFFKKLLKSCLSFLYGLVLCREEGGCPWVPGHHNSLVSFGTAPWGCRCHLAHGRALLDKWLSFAEAIHSLISQENKANAGRLDTSICWWWCKAPVMFLQFQIAHPPAR